MAHEAQQDFCRDAKLRSPRHFTGAKVLDIGSLDLNGSNRELFTGCLYLGVDRIAGKGVDVVGAAHALELPSNNFDVVISTEALEHDADWRLTLLTCRRVLKPGGLLLLTCATTGRPEHGTHAHEAWASPGTLDYYQNLTESDLRSVLSPESGFEPFQFSVIGQDLRFWGIRR